MPYIMQVSAIRALTQKRFTDMSDDIRLYFDINLDTRILKLSQLSLYNSVLGST